MAFDKIGPKNNAKRVKESALPGIRSSLPQKLTTQAVAADTTAPTTTDAYVAAPERKKTTLDRWANIPHLPATELKKAAAQDASFFVRVMRGLADQGPAVTIFGTARSTLTPNANGFANGKADYEHVMALGEEMAKAGIVICTGAGPGNMEGPHRGSQEYLLRQFGKDKPELRRGMRIQLPFEQGANPYIPKRNLSEFQTFLFRMEVLMANATHVGTTPGGLGTVAEYLAAMAARTTGERNDEVLFAAHDSFFDVLNAPLAPYVTAEEATQFAHSFHDAAAFVAHQQKTVAHAVGAEQSPRHQARTLIQDLKNGLDKIDHHPPAFSFVAGDGPRSKEAAAGLAEIAAIIAKQTGAPIRTSGAPVVDAAIAKSVRAAVDAPALQAFRMDDDKFITPGLNAQPTRHSLVLRQLMSTQSRGMVVTPDGATSLAILFSTVVDVQTKKMPKIPIVVFDPDGKFEDVKKALAQTMLSDTRKYINPEDLDIFTVTKDPAYAAHVLLHGVPSTTAAAS